MKRTEEGKYIFKYYLFVILVSFYHRRIMCFPACLSVVIYMTLSSKRLLSLSLCLKKLYVFVETRMENILTNSFDMLVFIIILHVCGGEKVQKIIL